MAAKHIKNSIQSQDSCNVNPKRALFQDEETVQDSSSLDMNGPGPQNISGQKRSVVH